jgi:hypothetical protein
MPTVIDSLVLELGLDPTRFTQQQREAVNGLRSMEQEQLSAGKRIESEARRVGNILTDFRRSALAGVALPRRDGDPAVHELYHNLDAGIGASADDEHVRAGRSHLAGRGQASRRDRRRSEHVARGSRSDMNRFDITGQSSMLPVSHSLASTSTTRTGN